MLKNENIICISSIDWDFVWQGHQEIMSTFAKNENVVLFIENTGIRMPTLRDVPRLKKRVINWFRSMKGFRKEGENLYIYSPIILPFPYSRAARWINKHIFIPPIKKWIRAMRFHNPIVWAFLPTGFTLDIINSIDRKLLVYYCIADFYELADNPKKVAKTENELIKTSDLIFAQGGALGKKCRRFNSNVHIFPFGVNIEILTRPRNGSSEAPDDLKDIKKPIIGYIGGIHRHIDFGLLRFVAKTHPEWSLVLVGPVQTDTAEIGNLKNVFLLGKKDFSSLPDYISQFDVGIIPYQKTEYTTTVYPTKLNEYHALGKPTVSTDLPEVLSFNKRENGLVAVAKTYQEFVDHISKIVSNGSSPSLIEQRINSAKKNSWIRRIKDMSSLIEAEIEKKSKLPFNWKESFIKLYRVSHRKLLKAAAILLSSYLIIFHTSLVWFMAEPLKISQAPERVDAIIVLGGGVGESGIAGQGYEERVQYAVELYKKGYADNVVFSSGYTFVFKEPVVMKALAISLGVPEEAIILEDRAGSTYKHIKLVENLLSDRKWNSILLVSSPYHMRRVSLVIRKTLPEIKVIYSPIPESWFYSRSSRHGKWIHQKIGAEQIAGILHEYIGIAYYWWKRWI